MGYHEFNYLVEKKNALESLQILVEYRGNHGDGVPFTLRVQYRKDQTIEIGTNELIGTDPKAIKPKLKNLVSFNQWKKEAFLGICGMAKPLKE